MSYSTAFPTVINAMKNFLGIRATNSSSFLGSRALFLQAINALLLHKFAAAPLALSLTNRLGKNEMSFGLLLLIEALSDFWVTFRSNGSPCPRSTDEIKSSINSLFYNFTHPSKIKTHLVL